MATIEYKKDIAGLRGLAILLVVIFHLFPEKLPSGFIGVDIFFVISGYLMTSIISQELKQDKFTILGFYQRRIKRLIPSILLVISLCFIFGYYFLSAHEFKELSKESFGGLFFFSNLIFLSESGYFDQNSFYKPLLHFWSLGVEEQFYLLWPLAMIFIFRSKINSKYIFPILAIVSFLVNITFFAYGQYGFDFYSPITRLWELMIGASITSISSKTHKKIFSYLGTLLLIMSILMINNSANYPGYAALLPTFASAFIIAGANTSSITSHFYSTRLLKWLGEISYTLYLVHWPMIVFFVLINGEMIKHLRIPLLLSSLILSTLIHFLIEKPFRYSSKSTLLKQIVSFNLLLGLIVGVTYLQNGHIFNKPFSSVEQKNNDQLKWDNMIDDGCKNIINDNNLTFCKIYGNPNNITLALIGDSTANHLTSGLIDFFKNNNQGFINLGISNCPVIIGLKENSNWGGASASVGKNCLKSTNLIIDTVTNKLHVKHIVMAFMLHDMSYWGFEKNEFGLKQLSLQIINQVDFLKSKGIDTTVTFGSPYVNGQIQVCMRPTISNTRFCKERSKLIYDDFLVNTLDKLLANHVQVFNQTRFLENKNITYLYDENSLLLLRDDHHYSHYGSQLIDQELINFINVKNNL